MLVFVKTNCSLLLYPRKVAFGTKQFSDVANTIPNHPKHMVSHAYAQYRKATEKLTSASLNSSQTHKLASPTEDP